MFALTADQIDSRHTADRGADALALISRLGGTHLALDPDQTSGDEVQALVTDARAALEIALALLRTGQWRVGLGVGDVTTPLPTSTRTANGSALVAARSAIDAAKKRSSRAAIVVASAAAPVDGPTLQAVLDLLLTVRERRSPEGWELHDLVETGLTQAEAAAALGITPQAASKRAIAAATRVDAAGRDALAALLATADTASTSPQKEGRA